MKIMKFYSNCKEALKNLPSDCLSGKVHFDEKDEIFEASKVLGMIWDAETDNLQYNAKHSSTENFFKFLKLKKIPEWTKRLILKLSATVYDPLGLISPFTVKSRSILQTLWKEDLKWDDTVPLTYMTRWNEWLEELFKLSALVKVPRFLQFTSDRKIELHVFCDASTKAFATCVYARVLEGTKKTSKKKKSENAREEDSGKVISVLLITAKARVTPSKPM